MNFYSFNKKGPSHKKDSNGKFKFEMNRSKSYTNDVRKKLTERQRDTAEVKEILTGAGFKKIKPKYSSKPTLKHVEAQHQVLSHEVNTEF